MKKLLPLFLLSLLLLCNNAQAAWPVVQSITCAATSTTSASCALPKATFAGDLVGVVILEGNEKTARISSVTGITGATFNNISALTAAYADASSSYALTYVAYNIPSVAAPTIVIAKSSTCSIVVAVVEFAGVYSLGNPQDLTAFGNVVTDSTASDSALTASALTYGYELAVGYATDNAGSGQVYTPLGLMTNAASLANTQGTSLIQYKEVNSVSPTRSKDTLGTSTGWTNGLITYRNTAIQRLPLQDAIGSTSATYASTATKNDLLLAVVVSSSGATTISGWTQIATTLVGSTSDNMYLFAKTSVGTETSVSPSGGTIAVTSICEYKGASAPFILDGTPATTLTSSGVASFATGTITTKNPGSLIFVVTGLASISNETGPSWASSNILLNNDSTSAQLNFVGQYLPMTKQTNFSDTGSWTTSAQVGTIIAAFAPTQANFVPIFR